MWDSKQRRLLLFGSLYFAQGAILSYFLTFNVLYLREYGFAPTDIGFFQAVLVLPFVLKIVLGMISDRFSLFGLGHRFPYIVLGIVLQLAALLAMPLVTLPDHLGVFFAAALAAAVGMALYDTCTDGLAVEVTPAGEQGLVQGVMVGARAGGILLALLIGSWLVDTVGWQAIFFMVASLSLPALLLSLRNMGEQRPRSSGRFDWSVFRSLLSRNAGLLALLGCLYALALDGVLSYLSYHADADAMGTIGLVGGLVALSMVGRIIGAAVSGWVSDRLGSQTSFRVAIVLSAVACLLLSLEFGQPALASGCLLFGLAYGFFTTVYAASAMKLSNPAVAASMFAVFMLFLNVGVALGQLIGGLITARLGFTGLALCMAGLLLLMLIPARGFRA